MLVKSRITQLRIVFTIFILTGAGIGSIQASTPPGRLRVTILGFANQTGDSEQSHWRYGIERLLSGELRKITAIKLGGGVDYTHRQLGINKNTAIKPEQARKMGELIEAQRVLWGSYERQNEQWQVRAHVLNVASGRASDELVATSADWFELRDELTRQIVTELSIVPSEAEQKKMGRRWTNSAEALDWYSRVCALNEENAPLSEQEDDARKAITADPQFAEAHVALAAILAMKGEFTQAEKAVCQALSLRPDFANAHRASGVLLLHMDKYTEAEQELREAHRLDPDDSRSLIRLAELSAVQRKLDDAIAFAEKARFLEPTEASIHAFLGFMYTFKGSRDKAMIELKEAERLDPEGLDVLQRVGQAYERMREIPLAVEHYEKLMTRIKEMGGDPRVIRDFEQQTSRLKASLTPTFIEAFMPKIYTEQSLQVTLRQKLTEDEMVMIVNPIAGSEEMKRWAEQLTKGATSDLDKAKALFEALAGRIQAGGGRGKRTAREVFAAWDKSDVSFSCQEFAKLFIALARYVNIKAFYVHLEKDYKNKVIYHDCAIVFSEDGALLVDPAYRWFGVPHKDFVVLDDVQAIAHHFFQHGDDDRLASRCRMAAKLHPNFAWGQVCLVSALCKEGMRDEARSALDTALRLEPNRWDAHLCQATIAIYDGDLEAALGYVRKALELNPESASTHYALANVFGIMGKHRDARDEFRACLRYEPSPKQAEHARRAIAQINEMIGMEKDN
jgi:tetratricopeptide (TPR) repeat protein/TolB-like protein